ncbi:MAG TPA: GNAT family N-acetyltransferase [Anaerolineaceae bacterium]
MICLRPAVEADVAAMARVQVDTRRATYAAFYPVELLMQMSYEKTARAWRRNLFEAPARPGVFAFLAETRPGEVVGIAIGGPAADQDPLYTAEIYVLYILPSSQRQGIGRRLVETCACRLREDGHQALIIWVLEANPARGFYERLGGKLARVKTVDLGGYMLCEAGYGWDDLSILARE